MNFKKYITEKVQIHKEIIRQINSIDKYALMSWGAKNYITTEDGIQFDVRGSKFRGKVIIVLDKASDTYTIELGNVRKLEWKSKRMLKRIFAGDLVNVLDQQIG